MISHEDKELVYLLHNYADKNLCGEKNAMHGFELGTYLLISGSQSTIERKIRKLREFHNNPDLFPFQRKLLSNQSGYFFAETKPSLEQTQQQYREAAYHDIKVGIKFLLKGKELLKQANLEGQLKLAITKFTKKITNIASEIDLREDENGTIQNL